MLGGFGFGSFIFGFLSTWLVNPHALPQDENRRFPDEVIDRVPFMLRSLACCWFALTVAGISLIRPYPKEQKALDDAAAREEIAQQEREESMKEKLLEGNTAINAEPECKTTFGNLPI